MLLNNQKNHRRNKKRNENMHRNEGKWKHNHPKSTQFSSVAQLCPNLCDPMDHSTPGLPFHHQLPEITQTHVH